MSEVIEKEKVEITEPESAPVVLPTVEEVKESGWSAAEIESAEKRGMLAKPKEEKPKADVPKVDDPPKDDALKDEPKGDEKPKDFSHSKQFSEIEFTDEQFNKLKEILPWVDGKMNPALAMFSRARNERVGRQRAQAEAKKEHEERVALEARLAALEGTKTPEVDADGNPIDPDNQPLTLKQLKEMQKAEKEAIEKQQREHHERASIVADAQRVQEDYAREILPDFDDTLKKAAEVMQNLETMVPEKWRQEKVVRLIRDLQVAAANADKIDLDAYHGPMIAHEIGQFHPSYGKKNGDTPTKEERDTLKNPKANGSLNPEQMKRVEANTQRRTSSASIPGGGGKRTVDAEEVGLSELNQMTYAERNSFREKHPERYAKIVRG